MSYIPTHTYYNKRKTCYHDTVTLVIKFNFKLLPLLLKYLVNIRLILSINHWNSRSLLTSGRFSKMDQIPGNVLSGAAFLFYRYTHYEDTLNSTRNVHALCDWDEQFCANVDIGLNIPFIRIHNIFLKNPLYSFITIRFRLYKVWHKTLTRKQC